MAIFPFFKMAAVRLLGFVLRVYTTLEAYLAVFIAVQNLLEICMVVLKICDFQYFARYF